MRERGSPGLHGARYFWIESMATPHPVPPPQLAGLAACRGEGEERGVAVSASCTCTNAKAGIQIRPTAPCLQGYFGGLIGIACAHMSCSLMRSHMSAAKMGLREWRYSKQGRDVVAPLDSTECLHLWD